MKKEEIFKLCFESDRDELACLINILQRHELQQSELYKALIYSINLLNNEM